MGKITRDAIRTEWVPVGNVVEHPRNPNDGDAGAISLSLDHNGQYRAIVVSTATDRILAGNHTWLAGKMNGEDEMYMHLIDGLTEEDEMRIMLADNQYARLATPDAGLLVELLEELVATDVGLVATGYDGDRLDEMIADLDTSMFLPDSDGQGQLDTVAGDTWIECPECGHSFPWSERANK